MDRWAHVNGFYQIYPRSFKDSNGDGVGDLRGIIEKLDYIKGGPNALGIDAIWLSPFYPSPMADFGYDIKDYYDVDPMFGTLDDFRELLTEAHRRGIKVMIDLVPNHTSDEHGWFKASRSSRDNEKRDWYVWRDGRADGSPPNNWLSVFGGSAWTRDEATGQYYLHSFLAKQPDLNWDNPEVRLAMREVMAFWLDMGVDGLRADAVRWLSKDPQLRDNPPNPAYDPVADSNPYHSQLQRHSRFGKQLFSYLQELTTLVEWYQDRIIVFEDYPDDYDKRLGTHNFQYAQYYKQVDSHVALPFNFDGMFTAWGADNFRQFVSEFQRSLEPGYIPAYCFGNHDQSRLVSRFGHPKTHLLALLQLTLPGLPAVYYGDEIGMEDVPVMPGEVQDSFEMQVPGRGLGRDPQRTPMQWSEEPHAGFSTHQPWLPVSREPDGHTVAVQQTQPTSRLALYQKLLALRRQYPVLRRGSYREASGNDHRIFAFLRRDATMSCLVVLNFSSEAVDYALGKKYTMAVSSVLRDVLLEMTVTLQPYEGVLFMRKLH